MNEPRKTKKRERNSSIELLRICAGMAVVILHFNYGSIGAIENTSGVTHHVLTVLEAICICAVNVFMFISGYYGSSSREIHFSKAAKLLIQTSAFSFGIQLLRYIIRKNWSGEKLLLSLLPINYFVVLYVVLTLVSPYLNVMFDRFSASGLTRLLVISIAVFSVYPTAVDILEEISGMKLGGLSSISANGSGAGYTIANFILVYLVAAIARRLDIIEKLSLCRWIIIWLSCVAAIYVWRLVLPDTAYMYSNFVVILEAMAVFAVFSKLNIHSTLINRLAPASFTCFLVHSNILTIARRRIDFTLPAIVFIAYLAVVVTVTYMISFVVMVVWNSVTRPMYKHTVDRIPAISVNEQD